MFQATPPEVIQLIIDHLLILSTQRETSDGYKNRNGYIFLSSWNLIRNPRSLVNLALTCKYLKAIVFPVIFKAWICCNDLEKTKFVLQETDTVDFPSVYDYWSHRESKYMLPTRIYHEIEATVISRCIWALKSTGTPQFHLPMGSKIFEKDALQYVHHLSLVFNGINENYCPWLGPLLSTMPHLQEVTLNLDGVLQDYDGPDMTSVNFPDLEYAIENLVLHGGIARTHVFLGFSFENTAALPPYLDKVSHLLAKMENLRIESLFMQVDMGKFQ